MLLAETRKSEAGRLGKDVRSDCHIQFELGDSGGVNVELRSRVEAYYGDSIRAQARQVLAELQVEHARLVIEDMGALPFVLAARVETAVRRSMAGARLPMAPALAALQKSSPKDRLRRSRLYLPGNEPKYFISAGLYGSDAIILDLEDSVHAAEKDAARILVRIALRSVDFGKAERMVRINQLPLGLDDLKEIVPEAPDLILLPKTETAAHVVEVAGCIRDMAERSGVTKTIWLMPILESAMGIENAFRISTASEMVCALTIGLEDYTADLGVAKTAAGQESLYARLRLVNAAKAAGVQAIDSVYGDVADLDGLARWAEQARALGFEGMGCVHPSQIEVVHHGFAPTRSEIDKALKIVSAYQDAQATGLGVVSLGSKMIDAPVVNRALKLVERARSMGLLPADAAKQE